MEIKRLFQITWSEKKGTVWRKSHSPKKRLHCIVVKYFDIWRRLLLNKEKTKTMT
jgi:hypothetical protein